MKDNINKILINIITRTGSRPKYFKTLLNSLNNQTYKNYRHIISNDNINCEYLNDLNDVYFIDKSNIKHIRNYYNLYLDILSSKCTDGWIIIIDDDAKFIDNKFLEKLSKFLENCTKNDVLVYQTKIDNKILPSRKDMNNKFIRRCGVDMCCFCVHHTTLKDITFKSVVTKSDGCHCGDYKILSKMQNSGKYNFKFINISLGIWGNYDGQKLGK
tara:strand:+ start:791 stop:1432 length:642 start_codon:yes stop_codon:yes gene_type:complete